MRFTLGIDVAKLKLDCALRTVDGKFKHKVVENSPKGFEALLNWLPKDVSAEVNVCMEATGIYWEAVAEYLSNAGFPVSVVNPKQIKSYGESRLVRTKTDKVDSKLIAEFCHERTPEPWQAPTMAEQTLRSLVLRLEALQSMRTQETNRLEVSRDVVKKNIEAHISWLNVRSRLCRSRFPITSTRTLKCEGSTSYSRAFPALEGVRSQRCWPIQCIPAASRTRDKQLLSLVSIPASISQEVACWASRACRKWDIPSSGRRSICLP